MSNNKRRIIFTEKESKKNNEKSKKEKLEEERLEERLKKEKIQEDIVDLRREYSSKISFIDKSNFKEKAEYIKKIMLLMLSLKSSGIIGVFGLDSDELVESLIEKLGDKSKREELFYISMDQELEEEKFVSKFPYVGCIQYKKCTPNIFLPISSSLFCFYDLLKKSYLDNYFYDYSYNDREKDMLLMTEQFFHKEQNIESLNNGLDIDESDLKNSVESKILRRKHYFNAYNIAQSDENFVKIVRNILYNMSPDARVFIWVKAYKIDFDLFEKIYKLTKSSNVVIVVSTLCDIDVIKKEISDETLCSGDRIINKFFNFNNVITHIEV